MSDEEVPDRCLGHWVETVDGRDFDCGHEFAGEIDCSECMYGPCSEHGGWKGYDPRRPRDGQDGWKKSSG